MADFERQLEDIVRDMSDDQLYRALDDTQNDEECGREPDVAAVVRVFVQRELVRRKLQ
jgi:hypothetical protein